MQFSMCVTETAITNTIPVTMQEVTETAAAAVATTTTTTTTFTTTEVPPTTTGQLYLKAA